MSKNEVVVEARKHLYVTRQDIEILSFSSHMEELEGNLAKDRLWILHDEDGPLALRDSLHCLVSELEGPVEDILERRGLPDQIARRHRTLLVNVVASAPDPQSVRAAISLLGLIPESEETRQMPGDTATMGPVIEILTYSCIRARRDARDYLVPRAEWLATEQIGSLGRKLTLDRIEWKDEIAELLTAVVRVPTSLLGRPSGVDRRQAYAQRYRDLGAWIIRKASLLEWDSEARKFVSRNTVSADPNAGTISGDDVSLARTHNWPVLLLAGLGLAAGVMLVAVGWLVSRRRASRQGNRGREAGA